jgi:hypothetical protein
VLRRLEEVMQPLDDGRLSLGLGNEYELGLSAIASFAAFAADVPQIERRRISARSLQAVRKAGPLTESKVLATMGAQQREYRRRPKTEFVLLSSLSIRLYGKVHRRSPFGARHVFLANPPPDFGAPDQIRSALREHERRGFTYVTTSVSSRDPHAAGESAIAELDALRAIWNLWFDYGRIRKSIGGWRRPRNPVVYGPYHTLHAPTGELATETYWFQTWKPDTTKTIDLEEVEKLRRFERWIQDRVNRSPAHTQIIGLLVRYVQALDESDDSAVFLKLWALLEEMTSTGRQGYDETVRRAAFIFRRREYNVAILDHLRGWRNRMVHEGTDAHETEDFVNQLKGYVEELLLFLLGNGRHFRNLDEFGKFLDLPRQPSALSERIRMSRLAKALFDRNS